MAALKEQQRYDLSCGSATTKVFLLKLTDSALRAFESFRSRQAPSSRPLIRFNGSQGKISIPRSENSGDPQTFSFYLSNVGRDNPQGSFDCIQQYISSSGRVRLDCLSGIQDKITVCATDDSYQKARENMAQVEEETRSRSAIVIKPGYTVGKRVQVRRPAPGLSDVAPSRRTSRPVIISSSAAKKGSSLNRSLRERLVHLLALKPYKRPELILRLQKDGLTALDKECLESNLQQVGEVNVKDNTFTLKDLMFQEVQRDWPGYTEGDQQLLRRILGRKQTPNTSGPSESPLEELSSSSPSQKRASDFIDPLANKKPRISHMVIKPPLNGKLDACDAAAGSLPDAVTSCPQQLPLLDIPRPFEALSDVSNDSSNNGRDGDPQDPQDPQDASERLGPSSFTPSAPERTASPTVHCKSKKKKHKEKSKDKKVKERRKSPDLRLLDNSVPHLSSDLSGSCNRIFSSELEDLSLTYSAITSAEQRQSYKNDFNLEYSEYRGLHSRIEGVTRQFTLLDDQLKQLQHGSDKYKTIHNQILQEYHQIKKTNPNYSLDKNRCELLHNKLSHIKRLIAQYDQHQ